MNLDHVLVHALRIKAYNDWRLGFERLQKIHERIVKNPKGGLALKLINADRDWFTYDFNRKHEVLETISHEICHLYKISPVGIFNPASWSIFQKTYFPEWQMDEFTQKAHAFYIYHQVDIHEYPCIVFPDDTYFFANNFKAVVQTLAHELGHAIVADYEQKIIKTMSTHYQNWNEVEICLDQEFLDPVETVGFLKFYEKRRPSMLKHTRGTYARAVIAFDGEKYTPESAFYDLWMLWEERCAYSFEHAVVSMIWDSLSEIGYQPDKTIKKDI